MLTHWPESPQLTIGMLGTFNNAQKASATELLSSSVIKTNFEMENLYENRENS